MKRYANYSEIQPSVEYFIVNENKADVIVNKFVKEDTGQTPEGIEYDSFLYIMNSFSCDPKEITKGMVEENIDYYLEYDNSPEKVEDKIKRLEKENEFLTQCIVEMSEVIYNG